MARDLARLPLDQSCSSHVQGIMLLSIPPYPTAQLNTSGVGSLLALCVIAGGLSHSVLNGLLTIR